MDSKLGPYDQLFRSSSALLQDGSYSSCETIDGGFSFHLAF
jgi:hypothetical protein